MNIIVFVLAIPAAMGTGLFIGWIAWGPRWFDTSEGIDRKWRRQRW